MKNGKRFEANIKASATKFNIVCIRLKDSASSFSKEESLRFTPSNMCDFILFDGNKLLCAELKNHKGKSIPFSCIRKNQIDDLTYNSTFKNTMCGLMVRFDDEDECYFLNIIDYNSFVKQETRKSIPIEYFKEKGISVFIEKKKVNYIYRIDLLFREL